MIGVPICPTTYIPICPSRLYLFVPPIYLNVPFVKIIHLFA